MQVGQDLRTSSAPKSCSQPPGWDCGVQGLVWLGLEIALIHIFLGKDVHN